MGRNKWFSSLLGAIGRFLRPNGLCSRPTLDRARFGGPASGMEDGLQNLAHFSHTQEIQVEEIEQEVFLREWSQTQVERVAGEPAHADAAGPYAVDRRLPNFDRRQPMHDRRADNGHDRRQNTGKAGQPRSVRS